MSGRHALVAGAGEEVIVRLREQGMTVASLACELRDRAGVDRALERAGPVDVLVTSAPMAAAGSIEDTPEAVFRELLEVDLTAIFRIARACFASMRARAGGSMIHIASDAGIRADHETAAYAVTSAGLIALSELFAAEGASHGIRSNVVCPRAGTEVGAVVAWLASDDSAHLNGATLRVDDAAGAAMTVDTRA